MTDSSYRRIRVVVGVAALIIACVAGMLLFVIFVRTRIEFESSIVPGRYFYIIGALLTLSLVLALIGLPRLESFIALFLFSLVGLLLVIMGYSISLECTFLK